MNTLMVNKTRMYEMKRGTRTEPQGTGRGHCIFDFKLTIICECNNKRVILNIILKVKNQLSKRCKRGRGKKYLLSTNYVQSSFHMYSTRGLAHEIREWVESLGAAGRVFFWSAPLTGG